MTTSKILFQFLFLLCQKVKPKNLQKIVIESQYLQVSGFSECFLYFKDLTNYNLLSVEKPPVREKIGSINTEKVNLLILEAESECDSIMIRYK